MARPKSNKRVIRLSVSLCEDDHAEIARLAARLDLSTAWVVRPAVSEFVARHGNEEGDALLLKQPGPRAA